VSVEGNKLAAQRFFQEVFNERVDLVDPLVAVDVVDHNKIIFTQPEGPGGMGEGIRMLLDAFPDLSADVQRLVGEEDEVVAKVRMAGTNTGPYPRLPKPTGRHTKWESNDHVPD
jgi:predicted ester cyclase